MKGEIALISYDPLTNDLLVQQLKDIFGYTNKVIGVLYGNLENVNELKSKVIVCTDNSMVKDILKKIKGNTPIIVAKRTIRLGNLLEVLSLKPGSEVSVISNFIREAKVTINLLKQMGIFHLDLIPYVQGSGLDIKDTVITTGEDLVPEGVENVVCIGEKYIDISTIIEIFINLNMPIEKLGLITKSYNEKIFRYNSYNRNMNSILLSIFETISEGLAFVNSEDTITFCNRDFSEIVKCDHNKIINKDFRKVFGEGNIIDLLEIKKEQHNEIIDYKGKKMMINSKIINEDNKGLGFILGIQDITHIQKLENIVRKKLLSKGFNAKYTFDDVIGKSDIILNKIKIANRIAKSDFTVLIQGANGTGKEIFAQAIHNESRRKRGPFVAVNLASLADDLALSELFGYEEGAFTGAIKGGKKGLFEIAHGGTIFLDEIGDASLKIQQRLLRVIQEKEIMPVGSRKIIPIDVRIIVATNRNLIRMVNEGKFREDLYYRLDVLSLSLPQLRERKEDIKDLIQYFFKKMNGHKEIDREVIEILEDYSWPGNIRELENLVSYLECISESSVIKKMDLPKKLLKTKENIGEEYQLIIDDLKSKNVLNQCILILDQLKYAYFNNMKIGRNRLRDLLNEKNIYITDDQIRQRLILLKNYGLIVSGTTRQGSIITEKGRKLLMHLHKNDERHM
jgi:transcriptional regulator with PAS, ATPase and Fis domain